MVLRAELRGCSSLSDGVRHCLDVGATFLPPLSGIGNNLAQSLALCALWILLIAVLWDLFFAVVFFRRNLGVFSALIGLSTLDYNRWTYRENLTLLPFDTPRSLPIASVALQRLRSLA
jgi:hypothetical protein